MSFLQIPIGTYPNVFLGWLSSTKITTGVGNTAIGLETLLNTTTGTDNVAIGASAMADNTSGNENVAIGSSTLIRNIDGYSNTAVGMSAMYSNLSGFANTALGKQALYRNTASYNTAIGAGAGYEITTGAQNTLIGLVAGYNITTGSKNSILGCFNGNQGGLDIRTLSNYIVLSDGDGNPRLWINNTGAVNIPGGTVLPGGVANGVLYLNASKVMTSGSALTFDGTNFGIGKTGATPLDMVGTFRWNSNVAGTDIWQRFTGGAGLIYDGTTTATDLAWIRNGAEQMRLTSTGLGIGTASPGAKLEVAAGTGFPTARFTRVGTAAQTGALIIGMSQIGFSGSTNADALLRSDYGFGLQVNSAGSLVTALVADLNGNVVIGTAALATNATNGFFYVAGCAGAPTGVPTAFTGRVPIVVDTTNNKLYFYSGGAWRDAGP